MICKNAFLIALIYIKIIEINLKLLIFIINNDSYQDLIYCLVMGIKIFIIYRLNIYSM